MSKSASAQSKLIDLINKQLRPSGLALLLIEAACSCLILARRALTNQSVAENTSHRVAQLITYSSAASFSSLATCFLASFTIALACRSALSASFPAASAFSTRSCAARIEGSAPWRCSSPRRDGLNGVFVLTLDVLDRVVLVVETGEAERRRLNNVL